MLRGTSSLPLEWQFMYAHQVCIPVRYSRPSDEYRDSDLDVYINRLHDRTS